ncbi:helix-turn-helix domain-containing protein [Flavobacterium sp. ov086]|uniref:winged helix-turn-helix transcriptional regulator n=1 Tax=Flavobacterium sp. ov086 TaxID=1761785 RepID=UPI0020CFB274|nr:helix-turn-helix domain-containing protein [Flavobacterium sp. ov086]
MQKRAVSQRKVVTFRKVCIFAMMKTIEYEILPTKDECTGSLKNVIDAMYVLNGKWKLALILCLVQSSKRFNEIQKEIRGISPKVLANELKDLELNYLVTRKVYSTTPVSIIYEATEYSRTLKNVLGELSAWGEQHRMKIKGK